MTRRAIYAQPCPVVTYEGDVVVPGSGVVGEVQCRGPTVFDGYWKNPAASTNNSTAEAEEEDRWFCTGDLATLDARGYLNVVDRKTDMVLVGGENVYSAEVEAALHSHPAVEQAAVFGVDNELLGQIVHAAVVLRSGRSASPQELTAHARGLLSAYKVPAVLTVVESLPTSGTGKVIKTKLRVMAMAPKRTGDATVAVDTDGEDAQEYAAVWRTIPPTAEWSAVPADSSAIVVITPEPHGLLEPAVSTASEIARVTRSVLDRIGDELAGREAASVAVVSCPFVSSSAAPGSPERVAPTPHAPLTGLLRGVVSEQRRLRTGGAVRQICVSASAAGAGRVDDALNARLPPESEEPEVIVRGGDVLALRLERHARRQMPQIEGVDAGMHMASCLVVVEPHGDIAPGGATAAAIAFLASRPTCQSIAVWAPAMLSPGSRPTKAIDDVLSSAAACGVQVTFSAVDMRDDAQVARARQAALWGDDISGERVVNTVVCIRAPASDASGDVSGNGSALGLTKTELVHMYAQSVGLMNALDALKPTALFTISPFTAADDAMTSPLWLASRALHDAVATVISQRHGTCVASVIPQVLSPVPEGYDERILRTPASRIRTRTLPIGPPATTCSPAVTPSRATPHEHLDQRRDTRGHQPHLSDQEDPRRRSILIFFAAPHKTTAMAPVRPAPHPASKSTRRRLTSPLKTPENHGTRSLTACDGAAATRRGDTTPATRCRLRQTPRSRRRLPERRAVERHSCLARTTTPRLGQRPRKISAYQFFDHDQFFDTGHRRRARARPARARADASRRAGACDASFDTATALLAPRYTAYIVHRRSGFTQNESYEPSTFFIFSCCSTEANIWTRPSTSTRTGARGTVCVCVPGVRDTSFRDLFGTATRLGYFRPEKWTSVGPCLPVEQESHKFARQAQASSAAAA